MPVVVAKASTNAAAVVDDFLDRALSQHAEPLGQLERLDQSVVRQTRGEWLPSDRDAASLHGQVDRQAGTTTTRRLGSSPSERLVTPSISASASWSTLRSADGMASSERATPTGADLFGHGLGEPLQRDPTLLAVPRDVDAQSGVMIPEPALRGDSRQILDPEQRAAARPDQQAERGAIDSDLDLVALDGGVNGGVEAERVRQPTDELQRRLAHLLDVGLLYRPRRGHLVRFLFRCRRLVVRRHVPSLLAAR